jgi:hypothetical protein
LDFEKKSDGWAHSSPIAIYIYPLRRNVLGSEVDLATMTPRRFQGFLGVDHAWRPRLNANVTVVEVLVMNML